MPKQGHKQQSHDDKQKGCSKRLCKSRKGESSSTTTNASIEEKLDDFKRKKRNFTNISSVCSDTGEKTKSANNDQCPIGTNDTSSSTSREIQDNFLKLQSLVNEKLPQCKVWLLFSNS